MKFNDDLREKIDQLMELPRDQDFKEIGDKWVLPLDQDFEFVRQKKLFLSQQFP